MQSLFKETTALKPKGTKKNKFTPEEDQKIIQAVQKYGQQAWSLIAECVPNRTARQCRERYKNYLSPDICTSKWTKEEDDLLKSLIEKYGPVWSKIATFFVNRTDVFLKNKWVNIKRREKRENKCMNLVSMLAQPIKQIPEPVENPVDPFYLNSSIENTELTPFDGGLTDLCPMENWDFNPICFGDQEILF